MKSYQFDDFMLCPLNGLYAGLNIIALPPKQLEVLRVLVSKQGMIVSKEEIIRLVWKGGIVSDESLCRCIYALRKTLRSYSNKEYIKTFYGRGYCFQHEVKVLCS